MKIIKYKFLSCEINHGTEDAPELEQVYLDKVVRCSDADFEANYAIAKAEAYNGEVTVKEVPDPEVPETNDVSWDTMAEAITEGVNEV